MPATPVDLYAAAFRAQCQATRRTMVEEVGLVGVLPAGEDHSLQLLVVQDEAYDVLAALLAKAPRAGMVRIFAAAPRCAELVAERCAWPCETVTAMTCRDLSAVPELTLPAGLTVRSVKRLPEDEGARVTLEDAVAAARAAAPGIGGPPDAFANYLRGLPSAFRLFAAVGPDDEIRATAGFGVFGQDATVIFVNTDGDWRGRGIGRAMTAHALRGACRAGATRAALDASDIGRSIYLRLGFENAGTLTRFVSRPRTPGSVPRR